jgi:N-dimethylarginine dimethylaminohydrolase
VTTLHEFLTENMMTETFHDQSLLKQYWEYPWGTTNAVGQVGRMLVHRPGDEVNALRRGRYEPEANAFVVRDTNRQVRAYSLSENPPNLKHMQDEHDNLTKALRDAGADVIDIHLGNEFVNQVFMRDMGMVIPGGIILSRFALDMRYGETRGALKSIVELGMPILGMIQGDGFVEGGSFTVLDSKTAIVGRSVRVNDCGIRQLREILSWQGMDLIVVDIPACLIHLDEAFGLLDTDKALMNPNLLPHWFIHDMQLRGIEMIPVHPDDPAMTNNFLTVSPGKVIFGASGKRTIERLEKRGVQVIPVDVTEINKLGGGIHCSTLELSREDVFMDKQPGLVH